MTTQSRGAGRQRSTALFMLLVLAVLVRPAMAAVSVKLDRATVYEGDVFALIIENTGQPGGNPDLSPLNRDFEVLGTGTSNQFSMVNGRTSSRTTWTVRLRARRIGNLEVPPLTVGGDQTRALSVEVVEIPETVASQQEANAFIEVEVDADGPLFVQQQILYKVRLYQDDRVLGGELSAPNVDGALVEQLGTDRRYSATRDGRRYRVTERLYAIAPEKSGELRIPPVGFRGRLAPPPQSAPAPGGVRDPFTQRFFSNTPFAQDPFFSNAFSGNARPLRVSSKAITVEVQPPPAAAGRPWLPAETLTLQDSWATRPPDMRSGEPVTRTITIQARGLNGAQLPLLEPEPPERTRLYVGATANDTRSDGNGVYGVSRQTFTYIPSQAGRLSIPAVELTWWNTLKDRAETARLARWELDVVPGAAAGGPGAPLAATPQTDGRAPATDRPPVAEGSGGAVGWWLVAGITLALALYGFFTRRGGRRKPFERPNAASIQPPRTPTATKQTADVRQRVAALEAACGRDDPGAAAHALLALGRVRWPGSPPANLGDLAQRFGRELGSEILALDRALYAPDETPWRGDALSQRLGAVDWRPEQTNDEQDSGSLPPLYPQNV